MLTISEICDQYAWLYLEPFRPEVWDHTFPVDGAFVCVKSVGDTDYVMFRGSATFLDWIEDFQHLAVPFDDPYLGPVHPGARDGVLQVKAALDKVLQRKYILCGHSLGALHAGIYAGYKSVEGNPPQSIILWGEPKAGGQKLHDIVNSSVSDVTSYLNQNKDGHDRIYDVPFDFFNIIYRHVCETPTPVQASPDPLDPWLTFRYHHFYLYGKALGSTSPQMQALK